MKILLSGSTGFIGRRVLPLLAEHEVFCLTRTNKKEVQDFGAEVVIHLAWPSVYGDHRYDEEVQIEGYVLTCQLISFTRETCTRWVGVGSQAELTQPHTAYGKNKNNARLVTRQLLPNRASFAWARFYSVYGPGMASCSFLPYLIRELLAGHDPALTDQDLPWDWLYVDDAARALVQLALLPPATGIFDIGYGMNISTRMAAFMVCNQINPTVTLRFGARPRRTQEIDGIHPDVSRICNLGWTPLVTFGDGVDRLIRSIREQHDQDSIQHRRH